MSTTFLVTTAIRWLGYVALAALIGRLVLETVVLRADVAAGVVRRARLRGWCAACVAMLLLTSAGDLVLRTQTMAGGDLAAALRATPTVLQQTHFGTLWIARYVLLALSLILVAWTSRAARLAALAFALGVALTTSLTGHAGDWGDLSFTAAVDWVHVSAAATWAGGLLALALAARDLVASAASSAVPLVARRFSRLAGWCLLAVVATGAYNAWVQVPTVAALWTTPYGRVLLVKLALVAVVVWCGAVNRYTVLPSLSGARARGIPGRVFRLGRLAVFGPRRASRARMPSRFVRYVTGEAVVGIAIFGCTAWLVDTAPARHAMHVQHAQRDVQEGHAPIHVTMAELHAAGGVPRGWSFTPPAGDAKRGRAVFARLECFACHKIAGEDFPAPTKGGPDLTDVGEHHPAGYLTESIMNPNAIIVDGPGYTGPDGRSTMPSYGDVLSVSELADLVAYLESR